MGHLIVPLKAILPFYAQAANHPLPGDLTYADGSVLSIGTHGIAGGASPYTLPELRNTFLIGADRTKAVKDGGQHLLFISNMTASGNSYNYQSMDYPLSYTVQSGDFLQYDVYWPSANIPGSGGGCGAVDLGFSDATYLRDVNPSDQNGLAAHPTTDLRTFALDQWYTRRISLSGVVGKLLNSVILAHEYDGTFASLTTRFQNIYVTNTAGDQINFIGWQSGDGTPGSYAVAALSSATFVSGNASTLSAPGPEGRSGTHQRKLRTHHVPSHNHTGSSTSAGSHSHSCFMTVHGFHSHGADNGQFLVLSQSNTKASTGSGYYQITCYTGATAPGGSHAHNVSGGVGGSHGHNLSITTASSGGTNASSSPFDPRPRYYGVIWCLKSGKPSGRALSIPMGTIIMWYADTQNETLPASFSYCDGSTLTAGNHSVPNALGSMSYSLVLPDLRNRHLIGADRTKTFGTAGTSIDSTSAAPGPGYASGSHSLSITVANFSNHNHTGSTDAQWGSHNHNFFVSAGGDHVHGPQAYNQASATGQQIALPAGGGVPLDQRMSTGIAGLTAADSHAHNFYIDNAGGHDHTITVNSNGSGTAWDNRPPFIGLIHLMKTTVGMLSVPLKTVVAFRATTTNESIVPTDGTWALCDGSTLTPGQFDMAANSGGNYVLPNFANFFPLGADRTKAVANTGDTTDTAGGAPGPKGTAGAATTTLTTSTMPGHIHAADDDVQGGHNHGFPVATDTQGSHGHGTNCHTFFNTTDTVVHSTGSTAFSLQPAFVDSYASTTAGGVAGDHGASGDAQGTHSHAITVNASGAGSAFQKRPRFQGMVFYMKVKR